MFNTAYITKIVVKYGRLDPRDGNYWVTGLDQAYNDPDPVRFYEVYAGGDMYRIRSDPKDVVAKVFEEIYKHAIKA